MSTRSSGFVTSGRLRDVTDLLDDLDDLCLSEEQEARGEHRLEQLGRDASVQSRRSLGPKDVQECGREGRVRMRGGLLSKSTDNIERNISSGVDIKNGTRHTHESCLEEDEGVAERGGKQLGERSENEDVETGQHGELAALSTSSLGEKQVLELLERSVCRMKIADTR